MKLFIIILIIAIAGVGGFFLVRSLTNHSNTNTDTITSNIDVTDNSGTGIDTIGQANSVTIAGSEFKYLPSSVTVQRGTTVSLTFVNQGTMTHDLVIDELNVRTRSLAPGQSQTVEFTPTQAGTFSYYCSIPGHRAQGMEGTLTVE